MLKTRNLGFSVGHRWILKNINMSSQEGQLLAILGANGSGKTTLLRLLSGELKASEGEVLFNDQNINAYDPQTLARERAFLSQKRSIDFPFTSFEVALMGRSPYLNGMRWNANDREITKKALRDTGAWHLATRLYSKLSGGEAARVDLARVLAQEPRVLLLDEPTNHLDPKHQQEILRKCKELSNSGRSVVIVLHDLNLASFFADQVVVLKEGQQVTQGTPNEVFTADFIQNCFGIDCRIVRHPTGCPWMIPLIETEKEMRKEHTHVGIY